MKECILPPFINSLDEGYDTPANKSQDKDMQLSADKMISLNLLGHYLKRTRLERELSEEQVSKDLNVSRSTLRKIEAGQPVKTSTLESFCSYYELELKFIILSKSK